jgi:hypothetical protein
MEPHREEQQKALEPSAEPKPKRFRIVKLEERIAPSKGGNGTNHSCGAWTCANTYCYCGY